MSREDSMDFATSAEERVFATSVRAVVSNDRSSDWLPGAAIDDHDAELAARLDDVGLGEVADPGHHGFLAAAGIELGRALTPLSIIDAFALRTSMLGADGAALAAGGVARYVRHRHVALDLRETGAFAVPIDGAEPQPALDSQGFMRLADEGEPTELPDLDCWVRLHVAYLAGVASEVLEMAVQHARGRQAFGKPLLSLPPVQQMLADAATISQGLSLLAWEEREDPWPALIHAAEGASQVCSIAHQVHGAIGYTLDAGPQRHFRRTHATRMFVCAAARAPRRAGSMA